MKFGISSFAAAVMAWFPVLVSSEGNAHCTRGRLFVSDTESANLQAFDLDGEGAPIAIEGSLQVPGGLPGPRLSSSTTDATIIVVSMGSETNNWEDGSVGFVLTGVSPSEHEVSGFSVTKGDPSIAVAAVQCTRPIHVISVREKVSIFCDGDFDAGVNSTIWTVDENLVHQGEPMAVEFSKSLDGSHHGVAVPTTDGHILTSLATPERILRSPDASSLPR
jgi:hypothetical protein